MRAYIADVISEAVIDTIFIYHFVDWGLWPEDYFVCGREGGNRIRQCWFWNRGLRHLLHTIVGGRGQFLAEIVTAF